MKIESLWRSDVAVAALAALATILMLQFYHHDLSRCFSCSILAETWPETQAPAHAAWVR